MVTSWVAFGMMPLALLFPFTMPRLIHHFTSFLSHLPSTILLFLFHPFANFIFYFLPFCLFHHHCLSPSFFLFSPIRGLKPVSDTSWNLLLSFKNHVESFSGRPHLHDLYLCLRKFLGRLKFTHKGLPDNHIWMHCKHLINLPIILGSYLLLTSLFFSI